MTEFKFHLSKKENSNSKTESKENYYTPYFQSHLIKSNSESRTWNIIFDLEVPGFAIVEDYQNNKEFVLFDRNCSQCSCENFYSQELNTCLHIEAIKRVFSEINDPIIKNISKSFCASSANILCWSPENQEYFLSFKSSDKDIQNLSLFGFEVDGDEISLYDENLLKSKIDSLEIKVSPTIKRTLKKEIIDNQIISTDQEIQDLANNQFTLYGYQIEGVKFILKNKRAILNLLPGYGKTVIAILASKYLAHKNVLIVSPATLKTQWAEEWERFIGKKIPILNSAKDLVDFPSGSVIVGYELFQRNFDSFLKKWDIVILDEIQKIRNKDSKIWKATMKLETDYAFALSGTLIENGIEDLISIVEFLQPTLFQPHWKFCNQYLETSGSKILGVKDVAGIRRLIKDFVFKIPENTPGPKYPDKEVNTIKINLDKEQSNHQNYFYSQAKKYLAISLSRNLTHDERIKLQALLLKARQACNSAKLIDPKSKEIGSKYSEAKKLVIDLISQNKKVLIYSEWIESLNILEEILGAEKISCLKLTGEVPQKKRRALVKLFASNENFKVFLATDSGGVGLDGLQLAANNIIHLELPWNPAKTDQRNGRLVRLLQKEQSVLIYQLIAKNSIEEEMVEKTNERKKITRKDILE